MIELNKAIQFDDTFAQSKLLRPINSSSTLHTITRDSDKQHNDSVPNIYLSFFCTVSYSLILSVSNVLVICVVGVVYMGTIWENKFLSFINWWNQYFNGMKPIVTLSLKETQILSQMLYCVIYENHKEHPEVQSL